MPTYVHPSLEAVYPAFTRRRDWGADELSRLVAFLTITAPGLAGLARHDPHDRWYQRLALSDDIEVWLLGWSPGQGTDVHDHGGAAGAFSVLDGTVEESFTEPGMTAPWTVSYQVGERSGFGPERVHQVRNPAVRPAATLHAYSPPRLPVGIRGHHDGHAHTPAGPERLLRPSAGSLRVGPEVSVA